MYQHLTYLGQPIDLPVGKVVCVGRNYLDHIAEMHSEVPTEPLLFIKSANALCHLDQPLTIPVNKGECHNELEVAILLGKHLCRADEDEVRAAIWGVGLGLDLTLRDVQAKLKASGHPWERAKAFDFSCPMSGFVPASQAGDLTDVNFTLHVNGAQRQQGNTALMLYDIVTLIGLMSQEFTLNPGDIILTGTPKGVGPLKDGDALQASMPPYLDIQTQVSGV